MVKELLIETRGQGLHEFTDRVQAAVRASGVGEGVCTLFVRHTSASLIIQENADPTRQARSRALAESTRSGWRSVLYARH
jgi:secondary thiamine-phosphate synthase enzyme